MDLFVTARNELRESRSLVISLFLSSKMLTCLTFLPLQNVNYWQRHRRLISRV